MRDMVEGKRSGEIKKNDEWKFYINWRCIKPQDVIFHIDLINPLLFDGLTLQSYRFKDCLKVFDGFTPVMDNVMNQ